MKEDKDIEKFTEYLIKEIGTESAPDNFLDSVMKSVKLESEESTVIIYNPLIPKSVWVLITISFIALSIFILTGSTVNHYLLSRINFSFIDQLSSINLFENIHFSKIFTFSFILFTVFVLVQLFMIKNFFNKQNLV